MLIEVELFQVIITEGSPTQVIVLREKHGDRFFPIYIGFNEAMAIDNKLKDRQIPRPLTHDLMLSIIEHMGGKLVRIVLNDLREETYFALLEIHRQNPFPPSGKAGSKDLEVIQVDSRPSDAVALAVRTEAPIFIEEQVLNRASTIAG